MRCWRESRCSLRIGFELFLRDETVAKHQHTECRPGCAAASIARCIGRFALLLTRRGESRNACRRATRARASVTVEGDVVCLVWRGASCRGYRDRRRARGHRGAPRRQGREAPHLRERRGRFDRSLVDVGGERSSSASPRSSRTRKAIARVRRAARPDRIAEPLVERSRGLERRASSSIEVSSVRRMQVSLVNDGPVTVVLDADRPRSSTA